MTTRQGSIQVGVESLRDGLKLNPCEVAAEPLYSQQTDEPVTFEQSFWAHCLLVCDITSLILLQTDELDLSSLSTCVISLHVCPYCISVLFSGLLFSIFTGLLFS